MLERCQAGIVAEQGLEQFVSARQGQRVEPQLQVIGLAAPAVLIFRPVVDQEQQAGRGQTLDQAVEQRLRLRIDPMQIFEDQQHRLHLAFAQQHTLERGEGALAPLRWIELQERTVVRQGVQEPQQRRTRVLERRVERHHLASHFGPDGAQVVVLLDMGVPLEQVNDREIRRGLAVRHRGALQDQPPRRVVGRAAPCADTVAPVDELIEQARLPHPGLADHGHHLAVTRRGTRQCLPEGRQLLLPPHKAGEAAPHRRLQAPPERADPHQLSDLDGFHQTLDRNGAQGVHLDQALHQAQGRGRQQDTARRGELFHARRQVHRLPDGRVVHVQVVIDAPHHHLAGVEPHPKVHGQAMRAPHLVTVAAQRGLHGQRRIAGPDGVVFMRDRGAKERHDAIPHDLIDRPLVAVHGRHHACEDGIEDAPGFLRVAVGQQLHGALEISEQDGDLLALAFQARTGLQDFFGQMGGGIRQWRPLLVGGRGRAWRRGRTGFTGPDEATAVVRDDVWVGVEEFILERLQVVVVQTELQREGTIGHAAAALQHGQRLVQHLLEGHHFSLRCAGMSASRWHDCTGVPFCCQSSTSIAGPRESGMANCPWRRRAGHWASRAQGRQVPGRRDVRARAAARVIARSLVPHRRARRVVGRPAA